MSTLPTKSSSGRGFVSWWLDELEGIFRWRRRRGRFAKPRFCLFYREGRVRAFELGRGRPREIGGFVLEPARDGATRPAPASRSLSAEEVCARLRRRGPVMVRFAPDHGVVVRDVLPVANEDEVREILAHRLDALTPWSADKAVFDFAISALLPDGRLEVVVAAVPRPLVDRVVEQLERSGLTVGLIDVADLEESVPGRFLLRRGRSADGGRLSAVVAAITLGGASALGIAWAVSEIHARGVVLADRERTVAALSARLADVPELRRRLEELRAELDLLAGRVRSAPSTLTIIEELSRILPDEVFLQRLELHRDRLVIAGYATEAASLVPLLEAAAAFQDVRFEAPSTKAALDGRSGRREVERFVLSARLGNVVRGGS
ncbi:MAG: PilN domain-containing protein [Geminicoccaceae bacterium]|nr:PilN domain-containing protein [Geminicoccaceae bacterium]